jgi:hypothetical protein
MKEQINEVQKSSYTVKYINKYVNKLKVKM